MLIVPSEFRNILDSQMTTPYITFIYKSANKTAYIEDYGTINRRGDSLTSGDLIFPLRNSDKIWNDIIANPANHFLQEGEIRLGFNQDYNQTWDDMNQTWDSTTKLWDYYYSITLFKGKLENARFNDDKVDLSFKDRMQYFSVRKIGNGEYPVNYATSEWNPADLVWEILTVYGGLSDITDDTNPDIDYTAWSNWKAIMESLGYKIKGYFTGQNITTILQSICNITASSIYTEGNGKIRCAYWLQQDTAIVYEYTESNKEGIILLDIDRLSVINKYQVFYGYTPSTQAWGGNVIVEDSNSQSEYGVLEEVYDDTDVWHANVSSATSFAERRLDETKEPKKEIQFTTYLMGFTQQVQDGIKVTDSFHGFTEQPVKIENLSFNVNNFKVVITGSLTTLFHIFILDDEYYGEMDSQNGLA